MPTVTAGTRPPDTTAPTSTTTTTGAPSTSLAPGAPTSTTGVPTTTRPPTTATPRPTTAPPAASAPRGLATTSASLALVDPSRPTVSRGRTIATSRTLTTTVVRPTAGGPWPLLVFAHGFQLGPPSYTRVMHALAGSGYVVAAPSFPLADAAVGGANIDRGDIPNQSGDLSFVIDRLLADGGGDAGVRAAIDRQHIGAVGHSDGADTVLDLGYTPGRLDARVQAVVAMSPDAMTGSGGSGGSAPLLITHGDRDSIVPYSNATTVFGQTHVHRFLMTLLGADHLPPVTGAAPWTPVLDRTVLAFLDQRVAGRGGTDQDVIDAATVAGVATIRSAG